MGEREVSGRDGLVGDLWQVAYDLRYHIGDPVGYAVVAAVMDRLNRTLELNPWHLPF